MNMKEREVREYLDLVMPAIMNNEKVDLHDKIRFLSDISNNWESMQFVLKISDKSIGENDIYNEIVTSGLIYRQWLKSVNETKKGERKEAIKVGFNNDYKKDTRQAYVITLPVFSKKVVWRYKIKQVIKDKIQKIMMN